MNIERLRPEIFDSIVVMLVRTCPDLIEVDCIRCNELCDIKCKLLEQGLADQQDELLPILKDLFVAELTERVVAIARGSRFRDVSLEEFWEVLSNSEHFQFDLEGKMFAIY